MVWKPKEKEISIEDAMAQAAKDLAPFWYQSSPLLAGLRTGDGFAVVPLVQDFTKKSWLIFFVNPTDYAGETALLFAKEWEKRYSGFGLSILYVLPPDYSFYQKRDLAQNWIEETQLNSPIVLDMEDSISHAFGVRSTPHVLLLDHGQRRLSYQGVQGILSAEEELQNFLRSKDPGLPLFPVFQPTRNIMFEERVVEFGFQPNTSRSRPFDPQGFVSQERGLRTGKFHTLRPDHIPSDEVIISGDWLQDREKIATSDPHASLIFQCKSEALSIVAQSHSKTIEVPKIVLELDGSPAYEAISDANLALDETGQSVVKVTKAKLYHLLMNLPRKEQEITLRFSNADVAPVSIYGLRFGSRLSMGN